MSVTEGLLSAFEWRNIGPPRGGRVVAVAGHPTDKATFWFGACAGGVWKTTDGGAYWRNVSDGWLATAAVGAIAVSTSDPQVVYVGMGESCVRNDVSHGDGVYRTPDGGRTWAHLGLEATRHISRVRVHPRNPDVVYVAALGDIFGPSPERGVYRTRDGGATWQHVLFKSDRAGAADLWMDPSNPRILYAAIWQAIRMPWALHSGGPDSSLFRSLDGGDTWEDITSRPGLPKGLKGRIGVTGAPSRAGRVWALVEAGEGDGGLYRSEDAGDTWERVSDDKAIQGRPWYYSHVVADPQDAETIYAMNFQFWKSTDGGRTFSEITTPHGDNHDLWIDPEDSRRMIEGNDGGACVSFNGGETFSSIYNQPTGQIYHVVADDQFPYRVYGTQQDNSAICVPSRSRRGAIYWEDCYIVGHAESGHIAVDPANPDIVFAGAVGSAPGGGGPLLKYDHATGQTQLVTVWPEYGSGEDPSEYRHRFQWTYPIVFSPHDPTVLYVTGERVFRSTDHGQSWDAVSPDLTRNDPDKLLASGGPITKDTSGAETYCTIFAFAESPLEQGLFWAGTDDGLVHISRDGGEKWHDVTPPDLPPWALVTVVEPSRHDAATAYVAATRYRLQDRTPYIFRTEDYGASWQLITDGIPAEDFVRIVRADPVRPGLLYAGTETKAYVSLDDGRRWLALNGGMPAVPVYDLFVKDNDLVAASHGRGFWILDDLTALRELPGDLAATPATLFTPPTTVRYPTPPGNRRSLVGTNYIGGGAFHAVRRPGGEKQHLYLDCGENPRDGATIWFHLRDDAKAADLELTILDASGAEVVSFTPSPDDEPEPTDEELDAEDAEDSPPMAAEGAEGEGQEVAAEPAPTAPAATARPRKRWWEALPKKRGLNRFTWDLRGRGPRPGPAAGADADSTRGWLVPPGRYTARLRVGDASLTADFEVFADPRLSVTTADLQEQYAFLMEVRDKVSLVNGGIDRLRRARSQLEPWAARRDADDLASATKAVLERLRAVEEKLTQPRFTHDTDRLKVPGGLDVKIRSVTDVVASADNAPTRQAREVYAELAERADAVLAELDSVLGEGVADLNRRIAASGLAAIDLGSR